MSTNRQSNKLPPLNSQSNGNMQKDNNNGISSINPKPGHHLKKKKLQDRDYQALHNMDDLDNFLNSLLQRKFILGMNLITGHSNLRVLVEIASNVVIMGFILYFLLFSEKQFDNFFTIELCLVMVFKHALFLVDGVFLVFTQVIVITDVIIHALETALWVITFAIFNQNGPLQPSMVPAYYPLLAAGIVIYRFIYWFVSVFVFGRDNVVSKKTNDKNEEGFKHILIISFSSSLLFCLIFSFFILLIFK